MRFHNLTRNQSMPCLTYVYMRLLLRHRRFRRLFHYPADLSKTSGAKTAFGNSERWGKDTKIPELVLFHPSNCVRHSSSTRCGVCTMITNRPAPDLTGVVAPGDKSSMEHLNAIRGNDMDGSSVEAGKQQQLPKKSASRGKSGSSQWRTGRWTLDEKLLFLYGLRKFGKGKWKKISVYVPQR